jgi:hypothetical protein
MRWILVEREFIGVKNIGRVRGGFAGGFCDLPVFYGGKNVVILW